MILLLLACLDPQPAIDLCLAQPGLHQDPAGVALWSPLLEPDELALIQAAAPTQGSQLLGPEGLAALRTTSTCVVERHERSGEIHLRRERPKLNGQGEQVSYTTEELHWTLSKGRVNTGVSQALLLRQSAENEEDPERSAEAWVRLYGAFPDPTLDVDLSLAEDRALAETVRLQTTNTFHNRQDDTVHAELVNRSEHDLASAVILVRLVDPAAKPKRPMAPPGVRVLPTPIPAESLRVELGPVDAGARLPYTFTLPPNTGSFRLSTEQVSLQ